MRRRQGSGVAVFSAAAAALAVLLIASALGTACKKDGSPATEPQSDAAGDVLAAAPCDPSGVSKGPWVVSSEETRVRVRWEACREGASRGVGVAPEGEAGGAEILATSSVTAREVTETVEAFGPLGATADHAGTYFIHEAEVSGLSPSTCYRYALRADPARFEGRLCTARRPGETVRFAMVGDTSPGQKVTQRVVAALGPRTFDFVLHGGDLQYAGWDTYANWFAEMRPLLSRGAFFPALGNHEVERPTELAEHVRPYFGGTGLDPTEGLFYRFQSGGVWFFALSTEEPMGAGGAQARWFEEKLADAKGQPGYRFSIVYFHKPIVTCGDKADDPKTRAFLEPLFERYGVVLILQSHLHGYERFELGPYVYVTTGGGGAQMQPIDENVSRPECASRKSSGSFYHAMIFEIGASAITGVAIDPEGAERDRFEVPVP